MSGLKVELLPPNSQWYNPIGRRPKSEIPCETVLRLRMERELSNFMATRRHVLTMMGMTWLSMPRVGGADEVARVLFEDPFQDELKAGWQWVRGTPVDHRVQSGVLQMRSMPGGLFEQDNNVRNMVLRPLAGAPGETAAVEVHVSNQPTAIYENAGLVLYRDDDNYVTVMKEFMRDELVVAMGCEVNGDGDVPARQAYEATDVWLRMEVSRRGVKSYYRPGKNDRWETLGECALPGKADVRIGLMAAYGDASVERWVQFRGFRILES